MARLISAIAFVMAALASASVHASVTFTVLPDLDGGGEECLAYGLSADGRVVVGASIGEAGTEAFVWTEATGTGGRGDLLGGVLRSTAWGVSADGRLGVELWLLLEKADRVARRDHRFALEVLIDAGENPQQRALA